MRQGMEFASTNGMDGPLTSVSPHRPAELYEPCENGLCLVKHTNGRTTPLFITEVMLVHIPESIYQERELRK